LGGIKFIDNFNRYHVSVLRGRKSNLHLFSIINYVLFLEENTSQSVDRGARGSVVGCGAMLQSGRSRVQVPMRSLDFFQLT
jgi:hypothetical protein